MSGLANPNRPLCDHCGEPHSVESLDVIWDGATGLYCPACREDIRNRTCTDCGDLVAKPSDLTDGTETGDYRCADCETNHNESAAERQWEASCEEYYGGSAPYTQAEHAEYEDRKERGLL